MSSRLDSLVVSASSAEPAAWTPDRARRVRAGVLRVHEGRTRRERLVRRGALVTGGVALLLFALLRGASSAPAEPQLASAPTAAPSEPLAARMLADAGYAHD